MTEMRVLVTSAGAGPAVAIIKAIKRMSEIQSYVLATDISDDAAGLYLADAREKVPNARSSDFIDRMIDLCRQHKIRMVIPILDLETPVFAAAQSKFAELGIHVAMNSLDCIQKSNDKVRSFDVCQAQNIIQPRRFFHPEEAAPDVFPLVGKPISGVGSTGQIYLETATCSLHRGCDTSAFIWQEVVCGPEYSIDTFGDPRSDVFVAVPRHREAVRAGQMVKGAVRAEIDLIESARRIALAFGATDVSCIQVIRCETDGKLYFIEINPRYGTGVSLSIAAGVAFPLLQWLRHVAPQEIKPQMLEFRDGTRMTRYWEEIILDG